MLVAFLLLVLLPAAAVSLTSAVVAYTSGKEQAFEQLESVAALKREQIRTWTDGLSSDLAFALAGAEAYGWVQTLLTFAPANPDNRELALRDQAYLLLRDRYMSITGIAEPPRFRELFLLSREGRVLLSTDIWNEGLDFSGQPYFADLLREAGVSVQQVPHAASSTGSWSVLAGLPVRDAQGQVLGVLCGRTHLARLQEIMAQTSGLGRTGETFLLGPQAMQLTTLRRGNDAVCESTMAFVAEIPTTAQGLYRRSYRNILGQLVLGVYLRLPELGVLLGAEKQQAEALRPMYTALHSNLAVAAAAVLLAVLASVAYTRGLAGRLGTLGRTAKAIAGGDATLSAPVEGEEEIRSLAAAFNAMTGRLSRRFDVENLVAGISRELLVASPESAVSVAGTVLARVGAFLAVDRVAVFMLTREETRARNALEWCDAGIPSQQRRQQDVDLGPLAWFRGRLMAEGQLQVPDVEGLPEEAGQERRYWSSLGIRALAAAPMKPGGRLKGFLAVEVHLGRRSLAPDELALVGLVADIVGNALERVAVLEALQRSEERYALAQKASGIGSWDWDIRTGALFCSDALEPIFGFSAGALPKTYKEFLALVHPEDRGRVLATVRDSFRHGKVYAMEHRIVRPDGVVRWVSASGGVFRSPEGQALRMLGMVRDITERKWAEEGLAALNRQLEQLVEERTRDLGQKAAELERANERLQELDKLKSAFLASVSHELRTPLTSILGFAKLIHKDFLRDFHAEEPPAKAAKSLRIQDNLQIILTEGERLTRLINDVLDLSKIESGRVEWRDLELDPAAIIQAAVLAVAPQTAAKPALALRLELEPELPPLLMDRDRLIQVLINLLNNAVKFSSAGTIVLEAGVPRPGVLRIRVQDSGDGIAPQDLEKIFDKFHQASQYDTLENKPQGTGLGLAISKQIVEHYGGRIWAESELGKGSDFIMELPVRPGGAAA